MQSAIECENCGMQSPKLEKHFECDHVFCELCVYYSLFKLISSQCKQICDFRISFSCMNCDAESLSTVDSFLITCNPTPAVGKLPQKVCDSCDELPINYYCFNCKIYFCNSCLNTKHNALKKFKCHVISEDLSLKSNLNYCNCMRERLIMFGCVSCDSYHCEICTILFHLDHNIRTVIQDLKQSKESCLKAEFQKKIRSILNIDDIIYRLDVLINANDKFSSQAVDLLKHLRNDIDIGIKEILQIYTTLCSNSTTKISNYIEIYKRQLCRLRLQQKSAVKMIGQEKHVLLRLKKLSDNDKMNTTKKLSKYNNNITTIIHNDIASFIKLGSSDNKRKLTILGGKIAFKGEPVKSFTEKHTLVESYKLYEEVSPNMLCAFRGNAGHCFVAYINNKDFTIELVNISLLGRFKKYTGKQNIKSVGSHLHQEKEKPVSPKKSTKMKHESITEESSPSNSVSKRMPSSENSRRRGISLGSSSVNDSIKKKNHPPKSGNHISLFAPLNFNDKTYTLKAHFDTIYGIRQYKIDKDDFILSFSEDRTIKLWSCDYLHTVAVINHDVSVRTAAIITHEGFKYILAGSFTKDYPIGVFSFSGSFINQIKVRGYSYHLDSFTDESRTYLFLSTYQPYQLLIIDFESGEKIYSIATNSYINSMVVTPFETPILTFIDRFAKVSQMDLVTGKLRFEGYGYGNYSITKWNEKYYAFCGKGTGFIIVDINDLSIVTEYSNVHKEAVKGVCKFQHHIYGEMAITIGQDQRINILK